MLSPLRFSGNFIVEKQYLTPNQLQQIPQGIPGQFSEILNDDQFLMLHTEQDDAKISAFFRQHQIAHTWSEPAKRELLW